MNQQEETENFSSEFIPPKKHHTEFVPVVSGFETVQLGSIPQKDIENAIAVSEKCASVDATATEPPTASAKVAPQQVGLLLSIANMAKSAISSGLILFPQLVWNSGSDYIALAFLLIITVCSHYSIIFLGISSQLTEKGDFTAVVAEAFINENGHYPLLTRILVNSLAPAIAFVKMTVATRAIKECMGLFVSSFIFELNATQKNVVGSLLALALQIGIMYPLTFLKDFGKLAKISFAGTAILGYILVITVVNYFMVAAEHHTFHAASAPIFVSTMFTAFSTMVLCFAGHPSVPNIVRTMKRPSKSRIFTLSAISMATCALMYGITGFAGKNTIGLAIQKLNFMTSVENPGKVPAKFFHFGGLFMSLSLCITGPLVLFPARTAIRKMVGVEKESAVSYHLINAIVSSLSITVGLLPIDIKIVTGLIGSLCGSTLVFLVPALTLHRLRHKKKIKLNLVENVFIWFNICLGIVCFLGCFPWTGYNIYTMVASAKKKVK